jgi:hypothetical protein
MSEEQESFCQWASDYLPKKHGLSGCDRHYTAMRTHVQWSVHLCQLYSLPNLHEEMDCKEDTPLTLPFCIVRFLLTVDNSDMN